jgi:hypothetical protein
MGVEPPGRQGARRENTCLYLTEEQRSRAGWIGAQTAQVIFARALSPAGGCALPSAVAVVEPRPVGLLGSFSGPFGVGWSAAALSW